MDDVQKWNQSRTIITLIVSMIAPFAALAGYKFETTQQVAAVNAIALVWMGTSSIIAIIYRIKATKQIVPAADPRLPSPPPPPTQPLDPQRNLSGGKW
jgi:hypothetical protein